MKLAEVIGAKPGHFELMNLTSTVDEDVFKGLLEERKLQLSFNGIVINRQVEGLMELFNNDIREYLTKTYDFSTVSNPFELFVDTYRFSYDVKAQCMYLEEKYAAASRKGGARTVMLYERICASGSGVVIKFLTKDKFDKVLQERKSDLIDMRIVFGMIDMRVMFGMHS